MIKVLPNTFPCICLQSIILLLFLYSRLFYLIRYLIRTPQMTLESEKFKLIVIEHASILR